MKKCISIKAILLFSFILISEQILAQSFEAFSLIHDKVIPPSPEAASIGKFGDLEINYNLGAPSINIPLFELKAYDYTLPISLTYDATGIRVDDVASKVGLGWTLNIGGAITRVAKGFHDDEPQHGYFIRYPDWHNNFRGREVTQYPPWNDSVYVYHMNAAAGVYDFQPDEFQFNFAGHSGKIMFDPLSMEPYFFPHKDIQILEDPFTFSSRSWRFQDAQGVIYTFSSNDTEITRDYLGRTFTSAWYLSTIESPNGGVISFTYGPPEDGNTNGIIINDITSHTYTRYNPFQDPCYMPQFPAPSSEEVTIATRRLLFVNSNNGSSIQLSSYLDRLDAFASRTPTNLYKLIKLSMIQQGSILKEIDFGFDYIGNTNQPGQSRLVLKSLKKSWEDNPYLFDYNNIGAIPRYGSYSKDHWGYYNGKNNASLVPPLPSNYISLYGNSWSSSDRSANPFVGLMGILNKITYPTKGFTTFEYEGHIYNGPVTNDEGVNQQWVYKMAIAHGNSVNHGGMNATEQAIRQLIMDSDYSYSGLPNVRAIPITISNWTTAKLITRLKDINGNSVPIEPFPTIARLYINPMSNFDYPIQIGESGTLLAPGNYLLVSMIDQNKINLIMEATLQYLSSPSNLNYVGGARIKKMVDHDALPNSKPLVREFYYLKGLVNSLNAPMLEGQTFQSIINSLEPSSELFDKPKYIKITECQNIIMSAYNSSEYGRHSGHHIGYSEVTVFKSGLENGISVYKYVNGPNTQTRSELKEESHYEFKENSGINYRILKKVENTFSNHYLVKSVPEIKVEVSNVQLFTSFGGSDSFIYTFKEVVPKYIASSFQFKASSKNTTYSYSPTGIQNTSETLSKYYYDGATNPTAVDKHGFLTEQRNMMSSTKGVYRKLQYDLPLQLIKIDRRGVIEDNKLKLTSAQYIDYQGTNPELLYELELANPIFDSLAVLDPYAQNTQFKLKAHFSRYNAKGGIQEVLGRDGVPVSYIWGYNLTNPIAQVKGAKYNSVAFTSFESDSPGNWSFTGSTTNTDKKSGLRCYNGTTSITKNSLDAGDYHVGVWAKSSTGNSSVRVNGVFKYLTNTSWTYLTWEVEGLPTNGNITVTPGSGVMLDDLRLHPKSAIMTTYTHKLGVGITSISDENNKITTFEYDSSGRLIRALDHEGKILTENEYHYQGQ